METQADAVQTQGYRVPFVERTGMRTLEHERGYAKLREAKVAKVAKVAEVDAD